MTPIGQVILLEFDHLTLKEKAQVLNVLVRKYKGIVEFAQLSETEKRMWQGSFNDLSKEYFKDSGL